MFDVVVNLFAILGAISLFAVLGFWALYAAAAWLEKQGKK